MRQSELFTKTSRANPKDEVSVNAQLLTRGGFVYKNSAGVYSFLPLGWRVIQKIAQIVREEMNAVAGQEIFLPALVEKKYLEATGRWDVPIGFKVAGQRSNVNGQMFVLGWTHEEVITEIASHFIQSEKDLPLAVYQIQTKFRNEPRAKSGLLRTREFIMKDLYSFHKDQKDFESYYEKVRRAYEKIFNRCGLKTIYTVAGGGPFTASQTHEFQVLSPVGEDLILVCEKCQYAENVEISKLRAGGRCSKCKGKVSQEAAIEVGNIFPLGTKYSDAFKLKGRPVMGSYGIGLGRVMAAAVEIHHDDKGIIWPEGLAPFSLHLLELGEVSAAKIYSDLQKRGVGVLYDDRPLSAGEKLMDADLLGLPIRAIVSEKTGPEKIEIKKRNQDKCSIISPKTLALT